MSEVQLGKLESVHPTAPVYLQRAAILAILSFVFFLAMLIAFTVWQNFMYFWMATAFLIVELFTLFGWFTQRKNVFSIYTKGFTYKKQTWFWNEIESFQIIGDGQKRQGEIKKNSGEKIVLTETIAGVESIFKRIEAETNRKRAIN
jgi:hypothetical protein